jgi:signal transduction histidine kinase
MKLSVRARLTVWFCLASCCGVLILGIAAYVGLRSSVIRVIDNELSSRKDGVDDFLSEHVTLLAPPRFQEVLSQRAALKPAYLIVQRSTGGLLYCGSAVRLLCFTDIANSAHTFATNGSLRVLSAMSIVDGAAYRFQVSSDLSFETKILHNFSFLLVLIIPTAIVFSTLGGYWLSGCVLKPVRSIIDEAHAIGERNLSQRLYVPNTGDEIQVLSETLNGMLGRIDKAFRQVTEITANASHELRTPTSIIRTAAEIALLNARPTVESHRQALLQICTEAEKNTRLLDSMLMLARIDSQEQALHFVWLPLQKNVRQAIEACRHLANAKDIKLVFTEEVGDFHMWGDPTHLNRLWLLLLDNAIKYTPVAGQVIVRLRLESGSEPVCEISDNGIGIQPSDLPSIFERFYRAENARLTGDAGSGLGLAIARWIADTHQARIDVRSVYMSGSSFRVTFKASASPVPCDTAAARA